MLGVTTLVVACSYMLQLVAGPPVVATRLDPLQSSGISVHSYPFQHFPAQRLVRPRA